MELIDQRTKALMEECKVRARQEGLRFSQETLEYIISNKDLLGLGPKIMIPTLYDYWVHDVEIHQKYGKYEVYPSNPFETVINTRPPISFYNDNNSDWLNVMIFYHVLAHIDFFQNNIFYKNTWDYDFCGKALAAKRLMNKTREEQGEKKRWVDYVIEFVRGIDNLVAYYPSLDDTWRETSYGFSKKINFYFGIFLKGLYKKKASTINEYLKDVENYNKVIKHFGERVGEDVFFEEVKKRHPEFEAVFEKHKKEKKKERPRDLIRFLLENSDFLAKSENSWMKQVAEIVWETSMFFQPQIRTNIMNEGWATYWHEHLFMKDERISGHEINYGVVNARVSSVPKVGLNPYALGRHLLEYIEELAQKGKLSWAYQKLNGARERKEFCDKHSINSGKRVLFDIRKNFNDDMLIRFLPPKEFQDFIDKYNLFVVGNRINWERGTREYFVESRNGERYRQMVLSHLYHPPKVFVKGRGDKKGTLFLKHEFEGRSLYTKWIPAVLRGIEILWRGPDYKYGGPVKLETVEFKVEQEPARYSFWGMFVNIPKRTLKKVKAVYTMDKGEINNKKITEIKEKN